MTTSRQPRTRAGMAMLMAMMTVMVTAALAVSLIELSIANSRSQSLREADLITYVNASSAANYTLDYLRQNGSSLSTSPNSAASVNLGQIAYATGLYAFPASSKRSGWYEPAAINGTRVALVQVKSLAAGVNAYEITADSMGKVLAAGTAVNVGDDVSKTITRGVNVLFNVNVSSNVSTINGVAQAMFSHNTYSYKANVDWWNSNGTATAYSSATAGSNSPWASALVSAFTSVPTPFGNGGSVNSNPQFGVSGTDLPPFVYTPPAAFGNTTGGAAPTGMTANALTGATTLTTGQSYHFTSISSAASFTITNAGNAANKDVTIYVDGDMGLTSNIVFSQNGTRILVYQGDSASATHWNGNGAGGVLNDPQRFVMVTASTQQITMNGNAAFGGVLIAPYASMKLNGTFDLYGGLMAKDIGTASGAFSLHYDAQLANTQIPVPIVNTTPAGLTVDGYRTR